MKRFPILLVSLLALGACSDGVTTFDDGVDPSFAKVKLKGGQKAGVSFQMTDRVLTAMGQLTGVGKGDGLITLSATPSWAAGCSGVTVEGEIRVASDPYEFINNGSVHFTMSTVDPYESNQTPSSWGCATEITSPPVLTFTSATITVEQPIGNVVLEQTFEL